MLTISGAIQGPGFWVYPDEANDLGATPKKIVGAYVLDERPRFAVDGEGHEAVCLLLHWDGTGTLRLAIDRSPPDDLLEAALVELRSRWGLPEPVGIPPLRPSDGLVTPVPVADVVVTVSALNETTAGSAPGSNLIGSATGRLDGARLDVTIAVAKDRVPLVRGGGAGLPLFMSFDVGFAARVVGVTLSGACDGAAASATLRAHAGDDPAARAAALLAPGGGVSVTVTPLSSSVDAAALAAWQPIAAGEVTRRLGAFLAATPLPAGDATSFATALAAALGFTLGPGATVEQRATIAGPFRPSAPPDQWIYTVTDEGDFFSGGGA
jgi:hypothetical protein